MPHWQSGDVVANGIRLHYTRTGGTGPAVVLAHGFSDDGLCWTPVAEALAATYDLVMVDARGHGQSDASVDGYGARQQADDLAGVIAALKLERPAILGHSMGAATTLILAGSHPDIPRAILLEDPPARWMPGDATPAAADRMARMRAQIAESQRMTRDELVARQRAAAPGWSEAEIGPWADAKLRFNPQAFNRTDDVEDWSATLRRITCPALLITADPEQGAIVTASGAAALRALVPHLTVVKVSGAGHNIRRDQFDQYLAVVRSFLTKTAA